MSTLLNIAGKIDDKTISIFETINQLVTDMSMPYVVVGATVRDMIMHHVHGATVERATEDVDFAIEVSDWSAFEALKVRLVAQGFSTTSESHRLISPAGMQIDIVPFGQIEDAASNIAWPPDGDVVMNMLGFREACDSAQQVRVQNDPQIDIPVAMPVGMVLLKLIAWTDRRRDLRKKDARDLKYLLGNYGVIDTVSQTIYDDIHIPSMEKYGWAIDLASANLLGRQVKQIALANTQLEIQKLLNQQMGTLTTDLLAHEMCENVQLEQEKSQSLLNAFFDGYTDQ
jgi:predicted nucleotidyltransferase